MVWTQKQRIATTLTLDCTYGKIHHFVAGKIHYELPISIAMLNYQRVNHGNIMENYGEYMEINVYEPNTANIYNISMIRNSLRIFCSA